MEEKKKGFFSKLFGKVDEKLEEKSQQSCSCCDRPKKREKDTGCC
ncbi:MAG: hypothetical protein V1921_01495 [Candidatus Altiarchaeota archaeon]